MKLIFDLEANGLDPDIIWCLVGYDLDSKKTFIFGGPEGIWAERHDIRALFSSATELIGHNILYYDLPVLHKLGILPSSFTYHKATDTLIMSQLFQHDRPIPKGARTPHGLEAWGIRNNIPKPEYEDWSEYTDEMLQRCKMDVKNNVITYKRLMYEKEVKLAQWDWTLALKTEHKVAQIQRQQEENGWYFDSEWAKACVQDLQEKCDELYSQISPHLHKELIVDETKVKGEYKHVRKPFLKSGAYSGSVVDWLKRWEIDDDDQSLVGGPFTRVHFEQLDLNRTQKLKDQLLELGWEPTEYNYNDDGVRTSPKITEDSLASLGGDLGSNIRHWVVYRHRKSQIEGWLNAVRRDSRIPARGNPLGAVTRRYTHKTVVNVPKADPSVIYGYEMRRCFIAAPGYKLVGVDADGLELRMLAHYMNDPEYTKAVVHGSKEDGTDVHTINQHAAGLPTRDDAKTFIYALIYGAGDAKIGKIIDGTSEDGSCLKATFFKQMPALERLMTQVKKAAKSGHVTSLDGGRLILRNQHKALNTLLQGGGAIVMKIALLFLNKWVEKNALDVKFVGNIHDEIQAEVAEHHVRQYKILAEKAIQKAGEFLELNVPLSGEAIEGDSWAETH